MQFALKFIKCDWLFKHWYCFLCYNSVTYWAFIFFFQDPAGSDNDSALSSAPPSLSPQPNSPPDVWQTVRLIMIYRSQWCTTTWSLCSNPQFTSLALRMICVLWKFVIWSFERDDCPLETRFSSKQHCLSPHRDYGAYFHWGESVQISSNCAYFSTQ